jgi:hypothetical protein
VPTGFNSGQAEASRNVQPTLIQGGRDVLLWTVALVAACLVGVLVVFGLVAATPWLEAVYADDTLWYFFGLAIPASVFLWSGGITLAGVAVLVILSDHGGIAPWLKMLLAPGLSLPLSILNLVFLIVLVNPERGDWLMLIGDVSLVLLLALVLVFVGVVLVAREFDVWAAGGLGLFLVAAAGASAVTAPWQLGPAFGLPSGSTEQGVVVWAVQGPAFVAPGQPFLVLWVLRRGLPAEGGWSRWERVREGARYYLGAGFLSVGLFIALRAGTILAVFLLGEI